MHIASPKFGENSMIWQLYRPISLLCIISKLLESVLFNKISGHAYAQYGYQTERFPIHQLLDGYYEVIIAMEDRFSANMFYLDNA